MEWVLPIALAVAAGLAAFRSRRARRRRRDPDPFAALAVQMRLGELAGQLRGIEQDTAAWARGRRATAVLAAYDDMLVKACQLAGVAVDASYQVLGRSEDERFREEVALAERGWSW